MGYPGMGAELARQAPATAPRGKQASSGPPVSGFDQTQPLSNDAFREPPGHGPGGHGGPGPGMSGPPPGYGPGPGGPGPGPGGYGGPPPGYGPGPGGPGGPPPGYGPGPGGPPPGYGPGPGGPPPGYGGPPPGYGPGPGGPPPGYGGPPPGYGPGPGGPGGGPTPPPGPFGGPPAGYGPGPGGPPGYGPGGYPGGQAMPYNRHPETEPVRALRPPYLASDAGRPPIEPWAESLKTLMLVFGVLLVACFVAPWKVLPGETVFSWTLLGADGMPASAKILPILLATTGVLAVVLGALPLATLIRGFAAAGVGLAPVVYGAVAPPFAWQELLGVIGAVTLVSGLLVRSQYTGAMLGRIMATVGAVCVLLPLLVPEGGAVPLVEAFKALGSNHTLPAIAMILPALLALVSMLVWLPPPGQAGTHIIAWIIIVLPLVTGILGWLQAGEDAGIGATLKVNLDGILYMPMAAMAWTALVGYGVATVAGKQLENG